MLLAGLKPPGGDDGVLNGVGVPIPHISDDHHVLGKASWHRERLGERLQQRVPNLERGPNDDLALVELPSDQASVIPPLEQPGPTTLRDPVELSRDTRQACELHRDMVAPRRSTRGNR